MAQGRKECKACGRELPVDHRGQCPICGGKGMRTVVTVGTAFETDTAGHLTWEKRSLQEYYEKHPVVLATLVVLTLASAVAGLVFAGLLGVLVGLALGALGLAAGPRAIMKVRHERIETGG